MEFRDRAVTLTGAIESFADAYRDAEKLIFPGEGIRWTGGDFERERRLAANAYLDRGLEPGDRVGFIGLCSSRFLVAYFAAISIGLVPSIINPREAVGRARRLGERFGPDAFVYDVRHAETATTVIDAVDPTPDPVITIGGDAVGASRYDDLRNDASGADPGVAVSRDDDAFVGWSTGTTGLPKGLVWSHEGIVYDGLVGVLEKGLTDEDVLMNHFTPGFSAFVHNTTPLFLCGARTVFIEAFDAARYLELVEAEGATVISGVPTQFRRLLDAEPSRYDLSSIRAAFYGGEGVRGDLVERVRAAFTPTFFSVYSTTETKSLCGKVDDLHARKPESLGRTPPLVDARAVELREAGRAPPDAVVGPGGEGELILRSPARAERVLDDPDRTADVFRDGWWYSGDVVRVDDDGDFFMAGRADDMIISGGINVFPSTVEDVLVGHPGVDAVAVIGVPDEEWGERVVAVVEAAGAVDADALDAHCLDSDALPRYARPKEYRFVDALPRTPTDKIDRVTLREGFEDD